MHNSSPCRHIDGMENGLLPHLADQTRISCRSPPTATKILPFGATSDERLLCSGLRHDLGFLVIHDQLLSYVLLQLAHVATRGRESGARLILDACSSATGDERLLRSGLRHDLWFLISHFRLLSEALPLCCLVQLPLHPQGQQIRYDPLLINTPSQR